MISLLLDIRSWNGAMKFNLKSRKLYTAFIQVLGIVVNRYTKYTLK